MGAEPWDYYVPYRADIAAALDDLRNQEFAAGRYNRDPNEPLAGSIEEAIEQADADGTGSILDIRSVADQPHVVDSDESPFFTVVPLSSEQLIETYGTDKPTRSAIDKVGGFPEWVDRGFGVYIIVHDDAGTPSQIYFGGYSFDRARRAHGGQRVAMGNVLRGVGKPSWPSTTYPT